MGVYLDNAATTFPKPATVITAVVRYLAENGAPLGRGSSRQSLEVQRIADRCRQRLAQLWSAESPRQIVFTSSATAGLNLVLSGWLRPGDHVVTTAIEHNSIRRPLEQLRRERGVEVTVVPTDSDGLIAPESLFAALRSTTRLVTVTHASNVTGQVQPVAELAAITAARGVPLLLDAAQTAGHWPIDVSADPFTFVVAAGHKGLLGPLGTGVVYLRPGVEQELRPLITGGTGVSSESLDLPAELPERFEAGNQNVPGIVGLEAGLAWIEARGLDVIRQDISNLWQLAVAELQSIPGVTLWPRSLATTRPGDVAVRNVGIISLHLADWDPQTLATILDSEFDIQTRAGLHCAPGAHDALGTLSAGGTLRFSLQAQSTAADVEQFVAAIKELSSVSTTITGH